ncbi:MAG: phenylacetaldehyde dehydrogenase [Candidatus Hinthialibacteria bacterium]
MPVKLFLNGEFTEGTSGKAFDVMEPSCNKRLDQVHEASVEDVNQSVEAAEKAYRESWRKTKPAERAAILRKFAEGIRANLEEISRIESRNVGKPIGDSRWEVNAGAELFDYYAGAVSIFSGENLPVSRPGVDLTFRQPIGVAACIVPWNYPFLMACSKVAPALAAGNSVILKPASYTPLSALKLAEIAHKVVDIPKGVFQVICGPGSTVGNAIVEHPAVGKISFTGETVTGAEILRRSAGRIARVSLELGGKSPNIICQDADVQRAAESSPLAVFGNTGQDCCARSRAFVHADVLDEFVSRFIEATRKTVIGDPLDEKTEIGPLVSPSQRQRSIDYVALGVKEGAKLAYGGEILSTPEFREGNYMTPAILVDVKNSMRVAQEEIFGPVLCVIPYKDEEAMIQEVNDCRYGLSGSIWTRDMTRGLRLAQAVESGVLSINCNNSVFNEAPFGGFKQSGIGRERGLYALEAFTEVKNVFIWTGV